MTSPLPDLNKQIKSEADVFLFQKGLLKVLETYGVPHVTGSYALDLMTWRDLDIYLETTSLSEEHFFELGGKIAAALAPLKMHFRNERIAKTKGLPEGLYWGIYFGNERAGAWKIDIWAVDADECKRLTNFCLQIKQQLTTKKSAAIIKIKAQCWQDPAYRKSYTSLDIYNAVLHHNIMTIDAFKNHLTSFRQVNL